MSLKAYEKTLCRKVDELNQLEKTKLYDFRRETARKILNQLKDTTMNLILVARAKDVWDKKDGKMQPVGKTYDALEIVEYLMDIVIQLEKTENGTKAIVKKSRIGKLPKEIEIENYNSIVQALSDSKDIAIINKQIAEENKKEGK